MAVTDQDLERLVAGAGRAAPELVEWLAPEAVDMTGEPESFVELREGRRLMVLAHASHGCALLGADGLCGVYAHRPADCRLFPFDVAPPGERPRRVELLPLIGCDHALDGQQSEGALFEEDSRRWDELARYQARVAAWNRAARHRRRLGKPLAGASEFLAFLGFSQSA